MLPRSICRKKKKRKPFTLVAHVTKTPDVVSEIGPGQFFFLYLVSNIEANQTLPPRNEKRDEEVCKVTQKIEYNLPYQYLFLS